METKTQQENKKEFDKLIEAALADNVLTGREMEILLEKAKSLGMDPGAFEIMIEAKRFKKENKKTIFQKLNKVIYQEKNKHGENKNFKLRLWQLLAVLVFIFLLVSLVVKGSVNEANDRAEAINKFNCENFDDCLSKYKFEGSYYYMNQLKEEKFDNLLFGSEKKSMMKRLISGQISYWTREKNYEKAYNILQELVINAKYNLNTDDKKENIPYNEEVSFYNNLLDDIVNKMFVDKESKETILLYCKSFKSIAIGDEKNKGFFGGYNSYVLSDEPYRNALVKINEEN